MSDTLTFGMYSQNLELPGIKQAIKFSTGFVDPVENTGILIESDFTFVDESKKIR